ncbi:unnamed protein product [Linum tenue]|uniref:Uncharacterized protein n=1 Tax=Linum tenue TaxID=586396 RepID=A0AAV0GTI7_9ROSI|nr:unnamed protein product [Linum tenue]
MGRELGSGSTPPPPALASSHAPTSSPSLLATPSFWPMDQLGRSPPDGGTGEFRWHKKLWTTCPDPPTPLTPKSRSSPTAISAFRILSLSPEDTR